MVAPAIVLATRTERPTSVLPRARPTFVQHPPRVADQKGEQELLGEA